MKQKDLIIKSRRGERIATSRQDKRPEYTRDFLSKRRKVMQKYRERILDMVPLYHKEENIYDVSLE